MNEEKVYSTSQSMHSRKILIVLIACVLIGYLLWNSTKNKTAKVAPLPSQPVFTAEYLKSFLLGRSKINFSQSLSQIDVSSSTLPTFIKKFVLENASDLNANKIVYGDKKNGFLISYKLQNNDLQSLESKFAMIAASQKLKLLSGERTELVGLLEFSGSAENIRIIYTQIAKNIILVSIQTINLK